jgi:hypothetical protein
LYERHDFALETSLTRHVRPAGVIAPAVAGDVTPLLPAEVPEVARNDAALFGGVRSDLLERIREAGPEYAWRTGAAPTQYCLGRTGRLFDQIGPIAATSGKTAIALASAALPAAQGRAVVVDAYDEHEDFTAWLRASGFEGQRPLYRMRRPGRAPATPPSACAPLIEFAILGPEFG